MNLKQVDFVKSGLLVMNNLSLFCCSSIIYDFDNLQHYQNKTNNATLQPMYFTRYMNILTHIIAEIYKMSKITTLSILVVVCIMVSPGCSIAFITEILPQQRFCFYEVLSESQKYAVELSPKTAPRYEFEVTENRGGNWLNLYYKMSSIAYEKIEAHKLSNFGSTYSFCIKNIEHDVLRLSVKFQTGVELLDFELLPDKSDTENLGREIEWIEAQKNNLYSTIGRIEQKKSSNSDNSSLLSTKMILFAIIGLASIAGVNFFFFSEVKKTFKQRKLI